MKLSRMIRNFAAAAACLLVSAVAMGPAVIPSAWGMATPYVQTVPTIAALRTLAIGPANYGQLVYVTEYATNNGTGGGWVKLQSASVTDDNCTKFSLPGSHSALRLGVEKGIWVTDCGAVTNNTATDNSAAFNYADLAACAANSPTKRILIPKPNSYYLWSSATPWTLTCSGLTWEGIGTATFWFTNASLPYCMINSNVALTTGLSLKNLAFETNQGASGAVTCLYMKGISGSFDGVNFPKELAGTTGFRNPMRFESDDTHLAISNTFNNLGTRTYCDTGAIGVNFVASAATVNNGITTERFVNGEVDSCLGKGIRSEGAINVWGTIFEESSAVCIELVNPSGAGETSDNVGSAITAAYFENCTTYTVSLNGSRVYWNAVVSNGFLSTPKIFDLTGRNMILSPPYVNTYSERIQIPDGTTTPNVTNGTVFYTSNTTGTVSITDFQISGGHCVQGHSILLWISDTHTSVNEGTYIHNAGSANNTTRGWYGYTCITGGWRQTSFGAN